MRIPSPTRGRTLRRAPPPYCPGFPAAEEYRIGDRADIHPGDKIHVQDVEEGLRLVAGGRESIKVVLTSF